MKKNNLIKCIYTVLFLLISNLNLFSQGIGINTDGSVAHTSSMLDVKSSSRGLLAPRMTQAQRDAIASPAIGLLIYQTDGTTGFYVFNGSAWSPVTGAGSSKWILNGSNIYNSNAGSVGIGISSPAATLDVARGTASGGTAMFRGTTNASHFNYSTNEDTYIRGGKNNSAVYINDAFLFTYLGAAEFYGSFPRLKFIHNGQESGFVEGDTKNLEMNAFRASMLQDAPGNLILQVDNISQFSNFYSGKVGIGTSTPTAKLHIAGNVKINGIETIEFGAGVTKELNAGKIGYQTFTAGYLDIVGAGTTQAARKIRFWSEGGSIFSGPVGINTFTTTGYALTVNGNIRSKEVVVETGWADYVFDKNYKLRPLNELENFIQENKHLPNIPSAAEIEKNGLPVGDVQKKMMEKIEELTLYIIEQDKKIKTLESTISELVKKELK